MHWKIKSFILNTIALFPSGISYEVHYQLQRKYGNLKAFNPSYGFKTAKQTWCHLIKCGYSPANKVFFEVGTGRVPTMPIAYWLMGANFTHTFDINPYLKEELLIECVHYIARKKSHILDIFGLLVNQNRLDKLIRLAKSKNINKAEILDLCKINYIAPGNAAETGLSNDSVDFHTSCSVFEHIPHLVLKGIINEGNRILSEEGLFIHLIDYTDHFSHNDKSISPINFLQYNETQWNKLAGNRYAYANRLRHDDFLNLFESAGHEIISSTTRIDERSKLQIDTGALRLDQRFKSKPTEILSTHFSWIISKPVNT